MPITIKEVETLRKGDYIDASDFYYRVIRINYKSKFLTLTYPFERGGKAYGKSTFKYTDKVAKIDFQYWNIIRKNSKDARGLERRLKQNNHMK